MPRPGPRKLRPRRAGTAALLALSLFILSIASDRLHNHPVSALPAACSGSSTPRFDLPADADPSSAGHRAPCLACLHQRAPGLSPSRVQPEGRLVPVSRESFPTLDAPTPVSLPLPSGLRSPPDPGSRPRTGG